MSLDRKVVQLNSIITFLGFIDTHLLIPVIALYATALGAGTGITGLIVGLYSLTNFFANILGGRWVDKFGYKAPLIGGLCGDTIAMLIYTLCQVPWHLALVRVFHGISGGLVGPATMSITAKYASSSSKSKAMSVYGIAIATATLVGYGAGGAIDRALGTYFVFYIGGLLVLIGLFLACMMPAIKATTPDGMIPTSYNLKDILKLVTRGSLPVSYVSIFAQYFAFGGVVVLLPLYITTLGMEAFHVGMLLTIFSLMFILVQLFSGGLSDTIGRLKPTAIGLTLGAAALVSMSIMETFSALVIVMVVYGTAYGFLFPAIASLLTDHTTPEEYGRATGVFHALITIGVAVGAPIISLTAKFTGLRTGLALTCIILILALILTIVKLNKERDTRIGN